MKQQKQTLNRGIRVRVLALTLVLCSLVFLGGCAQTVTFKPQKGSEVEFTITFKANMAFGTYNYYILFLTGNLVQFYDVNTLYFFGPGDKDINAAGLLNSFPIPQNANGGVDYFFANFFSNWTDYIVFNADNDPHIINGPFNAFGTPEKAASENNQIDDRVALNPQPNNTAGNTIKFSFPLSKLNQNANTLFYTVVTAKKANPNLKGNISLESLRQDVLQDSIQSIDIIRGEVIPVTNDGLDLITPDAAADIQTFQVRIL